MVQLCLKEYKKATTNIRRKQVLSWVASTSVKKKWIMELFGVTYGVISTALRHAEQWGPGGELIRLSLKKVKYRRSVRAAYLEKWLQANTEWDPAGKGKGRRLRLLPRHSGYLIYLEDHKREMPGEKPFCRSRFFNHPLQKDISNTKCCAGLCSHCIRFGEMVFSELEQLAIKISKLLKAIVQFDLDKWKKSHRKVKKYFVRGGMFQRSLRESCNNIHCCITFALSNPDDKRFQHKCDHDHTEVSYNTHYSHIHSQTHIHTLHSHTHTIFTHTLHSPHTHSHTQTFHSHNSSLAVSTLPHTLSHTHTCTSHTGEPDLSVARFLMGTTLWCD